MKQLFTSLFLSLTLCVPAQQAINLSSPESGTKEHVARDYIRFLPGYHFKATGSNTMHASIDKHIVVPAVYQPQPPSPYRNLNTSYAVGTTVGVSDVSPTGAVTYRIPIAIPPGTGGVQPDISIVYNSQTGNGLLGYGWNLAGISAVGRCGKAFYHDHKADAVKLNNTDDLTLDGQRLMLISGTNLESGAEYRTELETFNEIKYKTTGSNLCFEVKMKDGWILEYGSTADSYIEAQGTSVALCWLLAKITDPSGNFMTYTYTEDNAAGEFRLRQIDYTGNTGLSPYNRIEFFYETRNDRQTAYITGKKTGQTVLLTRIKVSSANTIFREYKLNYYFDGLYSKLTEVEEYGQGNVRYNSTVVEWDGEYGNAQSESEDLVFFTSRGNIQCYNIYEDFNGDGKTDFICYPVKTSYTSSDAVSLYLSSDLYGQTFGKKQSIPLSSGFKKLYTADLNGDGAMDLSIVTLAPNGTHRYNFYIWDGEKLTYNYKGFNVTNGEEAYIGDFNGNGTYDILIKNNQCIYNENGTVIANGGGITDWGAAYIPQWYPNNCYLNDFNGNGKTDILAMNASGCWIYELNNNKFEKLSSFSTSELRNYNFPYFGDFNGDGLTDILVQNSQTFNCYILYSTGTNFIRANISDPNIRAKAFVADVNRDGRSDIIHGEIINGKWVLKTGIFNGASFDTQQYTFSMVNPANINDINVGFGDFDGNGCSEWCLANYSDAMIVRTFNVKRFQQVQSITDGMNRRTEFSYLPMTDIYVCNENGSEPSFPVIKSRFPLNLVHSMSISAGGSYSGCSFYYRNPRTHRQGKGFLGFGQVEISDHYNNRKTVTEYGYNTTYYNVYPIRQKITNSSGNTDISTVTYTNGYLYMGSKRIFPYMQQMNATDHLSGLSTITQYGYRNTDDGNPYTVTEIRGNLKTVTTHTWEAKGSIFKNRPTNIEVKHSGLQGVYTQTTGMSYDSKGRLISQIDFKGTAKAVTTNYSNFNIFGRPQAISTTATGCPAVSITVAYDGYGRPVSRTDATGTTATAYDLFGRVTTQTGIDGLTTSYIYDGFGNLVKETTPVGTVNYAKAWDINGYQLYRIDRTEQGAPPQSAWYNAAGQEIKTRVKGFSGDVYTKKEYDSNGRLVRDYLPGYGNPGTGYTAYTYDTYKRPASETSVAGTTTYAHNGLSTTVNYPDGTFTTTLLNSAGLAETVTDGGGAISYAYNSLGKPVRITAAGLTTAIRYDSRGYQTALKDPNMTDTVRYSYDAYGMLRSQTNAQGQTATFLYDAAGRMIAENRPETNLTYHYVSSGTGKGQLQHIKTGNAELRKIAYNALGLPQQITEKIDNTDYTTGYTYDSYGQLLEKTTPSGFKLLHVYNGDGYLTALRDGSNNANIWTANSINALGQITQSTAGNGLVRNSSFSPADFSLENITLKNGNTVLDNVSYDFDAVSGNLLQRNDVTNAGNETFGYDALNRLTSIKQNSGAAQSIGYHPNGNISNKFDVGTYQYAGNNHAVSGISPLAAGYTPQPVSVSYYSFDRPSSVTLGNEKITMDYGPDRQRSVSRRYTGNVLQSTRYYSGDYEKEITDGVTKEFDYIYSPEGLAAIAVKTNGTRSLNYVHTDHLGSLRVIADGNKNIVSRYRYDAWGKRTLVAGNNNITNRGFTGHEHLPEFGLINMNARLYDPVVGRFLSLDPYVQMPDFSQSFNRYSYALNNPLIYTDPDGEVWWLVPTIVAAVFGVGNTAAHAIRGDIDNFGDGLKYFVQGAITGFALGAAWQFAPMIPGIGQTIQRGMTLYVYAQAAVGALGMIGGAINDGWDGIGRAGKQFLGNFYLDENRWLGGIWQGITRHLWEFPQQLGGHIISQGRNSFGRVTDVEYFGGATWSINSNAKGDQAGSAWGSFINMKDPYYSTGKNNFFDDKGRFTPTYNPRYMHEYGHTFDSRLFGISYLLAIGIPSAIFNAKDNNSGWTEIRANRHAKRYFGTYFDVDWNGKAPDLPYYRDRRPIEYYYPTR